MDIEANADGDLEPQAGQGPEHALAKAIEDAMRQEKMLQARELAESDVAARVETGEVARFLEVFLETQWVRILTLAHGVADSKPEALERTLKAMDDLIWSIKPKASLDERQELIDRLPAILSLIKAWLDVLKWEELERGVFFSKLADRHAAVVRAPTELPTRLQVELAVNTAQKASDRQLSRRARELKKARPLDRFAQMVGEMQCGVWVEFVRVDDSRAQFKLAWISPRRCRFIFTARQDQMPFLFGAEELAQALRDQKAVILPDAGG